ncbi:hypothetical protein OROMI_007884 [Orobanche minor]
MDRNWINAPRLSKEYKNGVTEFCKYATQHAKDIRFILCPCQKCLNVVEVNGQTELYEHLICHGIDRTYTFWKYHGEVKVEHSSSNWNSNYHTNVMADIEGSNSSDDKDIPNVINEELHHHPGMHENAMRCFRTNCGRSCTRTAFNAFKWTTIQFTRPHKLKFYSPDKMVRFQKNWAGYLYNRFLKGKLLK